MSTLTLSAQYMTSCCNDQQFVAEGNGCCGAYIHAGFVHFLLNGAVTDECAPYVLNDYDKAETTSRVEDTCPAKVAMAQC